jgi:AcrR family transcriptional regulator
MTNKSSEVAKGEREPERPYHHGDLKRVLVDTAVAMLGEDGGWQFTLREVARRAGVSHAAPYKHFADKNALLAEVAALGFRRLRDAFVEGARTNMGSPRAELLAAAHTVIGFGMANASLYRLMFGPTVDKSQYLELERASLGSFEMLLGILGRGQEAGVFRKVPVRGQAAACWAVVHGLTMLALDGQLVEQKVGVEPVEAALQVLLEGLET